MCCWLHRSSREWHGCTGSAHTVSSFRAASKDLPPTGECLLLDGCTTTLQLSGCDCLRNLPGRGERRCECSGTALRGSTGLKLQPCLPLQLQLPHSDRYEIEGVIAVIGGRKLLRCCNVSRLRGCDSVQPGQSCLVRCSDPWTGPEAWDLGKSASLRSKAAGFGQMPGKQP